MYNFIKAFSVLHGVFFNVVHVVPESQTLPPQNAAIYTYSNVSDIIQNIRHDLEFKKWTLIFVYRRLTPDEVIHLAQNAHWLQLSRWIFPGDRLVDFEARRDSFLVKCISCAYNERDATVDVPNMYRDCERRAKVNLNAGNVSEQLSKMNRIDQLVVVCRGICWDSEEFQDIVRSLTNSPPKTLFVNPNQPAQQESEEVFYKLRSRQGDVVLARHVFTEGRLGQVGYSSVSSFSQNHFITKRTRRPRMGSFGLINIFDQYCWFTLFITAIVFTFIANLHIRNVACAALQVLGCLLQVSIVIHEKRNSVLYITMLVGSVLIGQVFRTMLLSSFNIPSHHTLATVADLVRVLEQDKVRVCIFQKDFISSLITVQANLRVLRLLAEAKLNRKLYEANRETCIRVTAENENIVTILSSAEIHTANYSHLVQISSQAVAERVSGFLISPGHPFAWRFNRVVLQMLDMDLFEHMNNRKLLRWKIKTLLERNHSDGVNQLNLLDVALGMIILAGGLAIAFLSFVVEYCQQKYNEIVPLKGRV